MKVQEVEKRLDTDIANGLSFEEVKKRQEIYGLNKMSAKPAESIFEKILE